MSPVAKGLLAIILGLSIIPVSIVVMIYGWGLEPKQWGWISFGYLWMFVSPMMIQAMKGD